jgi:Uma2 family endonuclease
MSGYERPGERLITVERFGRLRDDDTRLELVRGRVVREPPAGGRHGTLAMRMGGVIERFVRRRRLGHTFAAETGFILTRDPATVRAPDIAFVAAGRLPSDRVPAGFVPVAPDLAVEILSPSNDTRTVASKVTDYLNAGCRMVWVVDPAHRILRIHRPAVDATIVREHEFLEGADVLPGFRVALAALLED